MHFHLRESKGFDPDRVEDYSVMMVPDCGGEEGTQSEIYFLGLPTLPILLYRAQNRRSRWRFLREGSRTWFPVNR